MGMQIAITGASGLIGSALCAELEAHGHRPLRVGRGRGASASQRVGRDRAELRWDPAAGSIDAAGFEGLDAVVHLAGEGIGAKRWSATQKARIRDSRLEGTKLLAATLAGLAKPPGVLISASAIGYYGDRGDDELDEGAAPGDDFLARLCVDWEAATAPAAGAGVRVVKLRTGLVLAAKAGALGPMVPIFRLGLGGRLGPGTAYFSWIALADVVGAIRFLLEGGASGPVNLTAPTPVRSAVFTSTLAKVLHRPALLPVPAFAPRLLLGREMADALLFTSIRAVPRALVDAGYTFRFDDLTEALSAVV